MTAIEIEENIFPARKLLNFESESKERVFRRFLKIYVYRFENVRSREKGISLAFTWQINF